MMLYQRLHQNEPDSNARLLSACGIENHHHYENLPRHITQSDLEESRTYYAHLQNTETVYESIAELQTTQEEAMIVPSKAKLPAQESLDKHLRLRWVIH